MRSDLKASLENPDFLRKYLLGEVSDERADAVERRLLTDDDYFELVESVEGDLLDEAARGVLSPAEKARVMRRLASSPRGQARLTHSKELNILAARLSHTHPMHQAKLIPFPLHLFTPRKLSVQLAAMAAGLFAVFGGFWLSMHTVFPGGAVVAGNARNDTAAAIRHMQAPERTAQTPVLVPPATPTPAPAPQAPGLAPHPGDERTAEEHRPPAEVREVKPREALPALLELALATTRSGDAQRPTPTLTVPDGTQRVEIHLPIHEGDDFPAYRATVLDADDAPVWQGDLVPQPAAAEGSVVIVSLPAAKLPQGTYRMELRGLRPDGGDELVGSQLFDVHTSEASRPVK
jgi:hypothetical protein